MRRADRDFDVYRYGACDLVVSYDRDDRIVRSVTGLETAVMLAC